MKIARFFLVPVLLSTLGVLAQSNDIPLIYQPLIPAGVTPGHSAFTLTVHGSGFVPGAAIKANGTALKTTFMSSGTLTAHVPASAVAKAATGAITVANPGSIASNVIYFSVRNPASPMQLSRDSAPIKGGEVVVGDFNNDNRTDILTWGFDDPKEYGILDTYFSAGNGNFVKVSGPQFPDPDAIFQGNVAADFNNDGKLDVSVCETNGSEYGCQIYLGGGDGKFTATVSGASEPVADLNGDGNLDVVGVSTDGISWQICTALGHGDGSFGASNCIPLNLVNSYVAAVGDFNGDGKLDVAITGRGSDFNNYVGVFLGNGNGTLQEEVDYQVPTSSNRLAVADVNGDGILDIVTNGVSILLGQGDGTFVVGGSINLSQSASIGNNIKIADLNGDGKLDLATVTIDSNNNQILAILLGQGGDSFAAPLNFAVQTGAFRGPEQDFGIADFNNDGLIDFVVGGHTSSTVLLQTLPQ